MSFNRHLFRYFLPWLALIILDVGAHEDLDIGVASVTLNKECRAVIQIKNFGADLPESFYQVVRPAYVVLEKGEQREEIKSLRALDKKKALARSNGVLTITSRSVFSGNPKPMEISTLLEGAYIDYGAANDRHRESMDCIPGKGQVAGETIPDTQPDIFVETARIDPDKCELELVFGNLTNIGLPSSAWEEENGVFLMRMHLPAHERQPDIPLIRLDPQQDFTRVKSLLTYRYPLPRLDVDGWRVGLWRVLDERDFANNNIEVSVPDACRATPR